jgi:hypothetical protein
MAGKRAGFLTGDPLGDIRSRMFRLIYTSHSLIDAGRERPELGEIFTTARRHNRELGITGALLATEDAFAQVLEGEETAVRELYERISRDGRHEQLSLRESGPVDGRVFGRWAMARVAEGGAPDIRLLSNARRGVIVSAGAEQHTTAEQEDVLSTMRMAIAPIAPA